jgi:chromosome segregation protein
MYLSSIDLFGFKSFAQRTRINFSPGITAVVGPNGCGKSNLVDAVRWVLGEQKESVLRSDRMENVIFGGTAKRRPLGMAEISLTLRDTDGSLPVEYEEVTVTRRLFRSGKSEYLLNQNLCRLRDVLDLFMGTGIGPDAYSIIELKMVEDILSGNPEELRNLLDEAIGVTRYKQRRKEALRRLAEAQQDRERAQDLLSEVERQTKNLKRQVSRVQAYQRLQKKARLIRGAIILQNVKELERKLSPLQSELAEYKARIEQASADLSAAETLLMQLENEALLREKDRSAMAMQFETSQRKFQQISQEKNRQDEELRATNWKIQRNADEIRKIQTELEELDEQIAAVNRDLTSQQAQLPQVKTQYEGCLARYTEADARFKAIRTDALRCRENILKLRAQETRSIHSLEQRKALLRSLEDKLADLSGRSQELEIRQARRRSDLERLDREIAAMQNELTRASDACNDRESQIEKRKQQIAELEQESRQVSAQLSQARLQIEHFEELHHRSSPLYAGGGALAAEFPSAISAVLHDEAHVDDRFVPAVTTALQGMAFCRVLEEAQEMDRLRAFLHAKKSGKSALLVGDPPEADEGMFQPAAKKIGAKILAQEVKGSSRTAQWIRYFLRRTFLLASYEDLQRHARYAGENGIRLVTAEGEFTDGRGFWIIGSGGETSPRILGLTEKLRDLQRRVAEITAKDADLQKRIAASRDDLRREEAGLLLAKSEFKSQQAAFEEKMREKMQLEAQIAGADLLLEQLKQEREQALRKLQEISAAEQVEDSDLPGILESLRRSEDEQSHFDKLEAEALEAKEKSAANLTDAKLKLERLQSEINHLSENLKGLQKRRETQINVKQTLEKENSQSLERNEKLKAAASEIQEKLVEAAAEMTLLKQKLEDFDSARREQTESHKLQSTKVRDIRNLIETLSAEMHQAQLQSVENEAALREEKKKLEGIDLQAVAEERADAGLLAKLERKIISLEPLNLAAETEYKTQLERLNFLNQQMHDLEQAEADLQQTIAALNKEARERFEAGFQRIRENFRKVFQDVFEGGKADITLDESDPLESRIELLAAPIHRRIGSLTLLSGGEKALTAISLLFAIYLERPSPFCILDEVDAPLDDESTARFCRMLKSFTNTTQFLVVTHNKRTMMEAQQLLGITMEEEGVSKVVPVKLN